MLIVRRLHLSLVLLTVLILAPGRAWAIGEILGQTKEELKLKYDLSMQDHGTGRVTLVFTLADAGRLEPLDEVQLRVPGSRDEQRHGGHWMDLVVTVEMTELDGGKRVCRMHMLKEWAERAEIWMNTHTIDGKTDPLTRLHHIIPIDKYLKKAQVTAAKARRVITC